MSKMNQKRRSRNQRRLHESQICRSCGNPGATETKVINVKMVSGKPSKVRVYFHRAHLPEAVAS